MLDQMPRMTIVGAPDTELYPSSNCCPRCSEPSQAALKRVMPIGWTPNVRYEAQMESLAEVAKMMQERPKGDKAGKTV